MTEILPYMFLGGKDDVNMRFFLNRRISAVINVAHELQDYVYPENMIVCKIPLHDHPDENISEHFEYIYLLFEILIKQKLKVLIHCRAGISRSATFVIHYIMKKYGLSLTQSLAFVQQRRPQVGPNRGFLKQLNMFQ